jgi:RNA polymerase sigma-70 factor, ECF subfamily
LGRLSSIVLVLDPMVAPDEVATPTIGPSASPDEVIGQLYEQFGPSIYRVARSILRDQSLAEDVVQETLLKAWQHLGDYRGDAPMRNWVLRIAHNTSVSVLRRRREDLRDPSTMAETDEQHIVVDIERGTESKMAVDQLWAAVGQLDELSRSMVVLREVEGMAYEEIAEILEVPLPTVKTRLFRARRLLSERLAGWRP